MRAMVVAALVLAAGVVSAASGEDARVQARAHFRAGTAFYEAGSYDKAIAEYEEAQRLLPLPDFLFNLGQAHRLKGNDRRAIGYYEQYLAAKPTGPVSDEAREHLRELKAKVQAEPATPAPSPSPPPSRPPTIAAPAAAAPAVVVATNPPPAPRAKRRWVWAVVGAAALVAAGVAVGVGVAAGGHDRDPSASFGTFVLR